MGRSNKREFLQAANKYAPGKSKVGGWLVSEKLDGTRCFWDGGITRGVPTSEVPWAGVYDPKKAKAIEVQKGLKFLNTETLVRKDKIKPVSTGLWSRYGNPIIAPDEFLNTLPCMPLDGELWAGRGRFQLCRSICSGDAPDPRFMAEIKYAVYSMPPLANVFHTGLIHHTNMAREIDQAEIEAWIKKRMMQTGMQLFSLGDDALFEHEIEALEKYLDPLNEQVFLHRQLKLPEDNAEAAKVIEQELERVLGLGAEGLVIRNPVAPWTPKRHSGILKYKPYQDTEATIVGYTSGRETDKGSKHLGKIGAIICDYEGKRLEVSGLTDEERIFASTDDCYYASQHPGEDMPTGTQAKHFRIGQVITIKYRELTDDGIPKEASYFRNRDDE